MVDRDACALPSLWRYLYRDDGKEIVMALSIRLPSDVEARLNNLAAQTGRTKSYYITEAICEHLEDLEDLYLAEQRLIANRAGKSQSIALEDVMKRYGLEG
jgi:RHH-type rel operon transcriptional repressor/antitoxin RelB